MPKHEWKVNHAYQKAISYSQYSIYAQCQHQWYLTYVKKHREFKPSVYLTFGTSFHETIQQYLQVMFEKSAKAANEFDTTTYIKERMYENYKQGIEENKGLKYIERKEFDEFVQDGITIMDWVKKNRAKYFNIRNTKLIGIEIPFEHHVVDEIPNVIMVGSMDLIFYNKNTETYEIYDIKTSTRGWKDSDKKDKLKISQILLYKHFYSKALKVDPEKIDVKFFVVKRRPYISSDYPTKYVQEFQPAQGKKKIKEAVDSVSDFVKNCFTPDAKYIDKEYPKNFDACKYCPFLENNELCPKK
jgi:hypothetical protein